MLIDTHSHLNFKDFENDYQEVLKRAHDQNVVVINVGTQVSTSQRAVELAIENQKTFATVGLHPVQLHERDIVEEHSRFKSRAEDFDHSAFQELARKEQVVAIGECGLDYYHIDQGEDLEAVKAKQKEVLHQHIKLANDENLPIIFHYRGSKDRPDDALEDVLSELKQDMPKNRGVIHSFTNNWQIAQKFLALGFYLGFNGIATFDKTGKIQETLTQMPADRILIETDCPYLTPVPFRGKRNEPSYVEFVAQKVAEIRQISFEEVAKITTQNAKTLFNIAV